MAGYSGYVGVGLGFDVCVFVAILLLFSVVVAWIFTAGIVVSAAVSVVAVDIAAIVVIDTTIITCNDVRILDDDTLLILLFK